MSIVVCPQQNCSSVMHLASKVYRFLPDSAKIKYLQNKNVFKFNQEDEANRCQRCFEKKHEGVCSIPLKPKVLDATFKYRQCPRCKTEVYMTQGKKRVVCENCHHAMCYLCGN